MPALIQKALAVDIGEAFQLKPGLGIKNAGSAYQSIGGFISAILPNIYVFSGLILFFLFVGGGFAILTSGNNPDKKGSGAKAVTAALVGFIIIFTSFWIIQIIEVITGAKIFQPGI